MAVQDLWGELPVTETVRTPVTILREQAALLEKKTENILQGNIHIAASRDEFSVSFDIIAPSLDDYSYRVLTIDYPPIMYPLRVREKVTREAPVIWQCGDEERFTEVLGRILSHSQIRRVVTSLVAQSRENN